MSEVEVRPARPEDKEDVVAFCEDIWEGDDYVPDVWDEWLADPNGQTFVAVIDDKAVAVDRTAILSGHEVWWQGLRVDPDYRGRGIVSALDQHMYRYAREAGATTIRLATSSENTIVHGMMDRRGFRRMARYARHEAEPAEESLQHLQPLSPDDVDVIRRFLDESDVFAWVHGLFDSQGWVWQELTDQQLRTYAGAGRVWGIRAGQGLSGLAVLSTPEPDPADKEELWVGYIDGTRDGLPQTLRELRRLAHERSQPTVRGHFSALPRVFEALEEAGYVRTWEGEIWVYEVRISEIQLDT